MASRLSFISSASALSALTVACVQAGAPTIAAEPGASLVKVVERDVAVSDRCVAVERGVYVVDGRVGRGRDAYVGSLERANQLLRNKAIHVSANTAKIVNEWDTLIVDSPGTKGYEMTLSADLYRCP
jgi:hypothetical protein